MGTFYPKESSEKFPSRRLNYDRALEVEIHQRPHLAVTAEQVLPATIAVKLSCGVHFSGKELGETAGPERWSQDQTTGKWEIPDKYSPSRPGNLSVG